MQPGWKDEYLAAWHNQLPVYFEYLLLLFTGLSAFKHRRQTGQLKKKKFNSTIQILDIIQTFESVASVPAKSNRKWINWRVAESIKVNDWQLGRSSRRRSSYFQFFTTSLTKSLNISSPKNLRTASGIFAKTRQNQPAAPSNKSSMNGLEVLYKTQDGAPQTIKLTNSVTK